MMVNFRKLLGVCGVDRREGSPVIRWANFFDTLMVLILLWLPVQWYLQSRGELSLHFIAIMDWLIWIAFASETVVLTTLVKKKKKYLRENWLNLLIIFFAFPVMWTFSSSYMAFFRYLRLIIILRLTSVQFHYVMRILRRNNFGTTLLAFLIITLLSGIFVSYLDPGLAPPWKGVWWAWETVTTVGYGDVIPHTIPAKIFAAFLMLLGVCLISIIAANFAAFLIGGKTHQQSSKELKELKESIDILINRIETLEESNQVLRKEVHDFADQKE